MIPPKRLTTESPHSTFSGKHKVVTTRAHSAVSKSTAAPGPEEKNFAKYITFSKYLDKRNVLGDEIIR